MKRQPLSCFLLACLLLSPTRTTAQSPEDAALHERVQQILKEVPLVDGHNDTPGAYLRHVNNHVDDLDLYDTTELKMHTDIPRLRKGGVGGQFWSVYIPIVEPGGAAGDVSRVIRQIDVTRMSPLPLGRPVHHGSGIHIAGVAQLKKWPTRVG